VIYWQEKCGKNEDTVLMRIDGKLHTSSPHDEVKVKNIHVQEVEKWISSSVKETMLAFIKISNALGKGGGEGHSRKNSKLELGD
jgi:hypothetical protein